MSNVVDDGLAALDRQLGIEPGTDEMTADTPGASEEVVGAEQHETTETTETTSETETAGDDAAVAAEQVKQDLILGRFKDHSELEKAYANLESEYGRRSQEWGEVKKELEQIREQTAPQPQTPQQHDAAATRDYFDENPAAILPTIQQAYSSGDMQLVYLGIHALGDVDPALAEGLRVEIAKRGAIEEMSPHIERSAQADFNTTFAAAWNQVKADHPDVDDFAEQILATAQADPETLRGLVEGTPESTRRVLTNLYKLAAFDAAKQDGALLSAATTDAATKQQEEAATAKRDGFVASPGTRVEPERKTNDEEWLDRLGFDRHLSRYMAADE